MNSFVWYVPRTRSKLLREAFYDSQKGADPHAAKAFPASPVAHAYLPQRRTRVRALTAPLEQPALISGIAVATTGRYIGHIQLISLQLLQDGRQPVEK